MKVTVSISRILVGALFIFSGLVKAIDPLGLAYKMQEFFEVWAADGYFKSLMDWLHKYATGFSVFMIALEVVLGVALLIGWQKKLTTWLLLLLTLFFTFLTSFVLFSGKIRACGCFGDCIPLTPIQTFSKDIILTILIICILVGQKYIQPLFKTITGSIIVLLSLIAVLWLQFYVLKHLPVKDCLPYKIGNNIIELRKMPADAVQDKYEYSFMYEKNGEKKEFKVTGLPDSTWKFVERKEVLIQKGKNNTPLINDFTFTTESGNDTTENILNQTGEYYLLFIKEFPGDAEWSATISFLATRDKSKPLYVITAQRKEMNEMLNFGRDPVGVPVFSCDGTAIKTAARTNPALFLMQGPVILDKKSWVDFKSITHLGGFKGMTNK
ncbi:BT_3928 family protein [Ferruginibacter sp. SUN106]|uniref:BT_3928 family protein n=1 Tax=Ferruginibacter sp. SUN106 TaxID=2978348 RepID=UPI003D3675D4